MRSIESTQEVRPGMVILTGTAYYYVVSVSPSEIRGHIWALPNASGQWGPMREVPLPSPTCSAYVVDKAGELFPNLPVSLVKTPNRLFGGGHNAESCYTPNPDGTVPEWVLAQRRYKAGRDY